MVTTIFGARGSVGRNVADGLRAAGEQVRVTSRDPGSAGFPSGTKVAAADLENPRSLAAALEGATGVFLYAKPRGIDGFVAAATAAGVRRVALLSSAAVTSVRDSMGSSDGWAGQIARRHREVEQALEGSGLSWTFIRPGMFATNTLWWWARPIREEGTVRMPYPDEQSAPVHEKDIAALAVAALTTPGHEGKAYTLYGPQSLTNRQLVEQIGDATGRPVQFVEVSTEEGLAELSRIMPPDMAQNTLTLWAAGRGEPARTSTVIVDVLGRPALKFAQWAADHADEFR
jgi:uncharacterized protein YbjT (DUF2867 family)